VDGCDLGTVVRCNPDLGDDLWTRTEQLASRTGVDATAIWEWGTIHRVVSGVYACSIGFHPLASCCWPKRTASRRSGERRWPEEDNPAVTVGHRFGRWLDGR
jgi:hypothetical protein